jgi:hypothetical protein
VFRRIERALAGEPELVVDERERERVLLAYFAAVRACFDSDRGALGRMKKISKYFCEGIAVELQRAVLRAETADQAEHEVRAWFDQRDARNTANIATTPSARASATAIPPTPTAPATTGTA